MDECVSPNLSTHNSVVLCAAAVKTIQNPKPRICLQTHPMDNVRRNRALFLGGYPFPRPGFRLSGDYGETFLAGALPFPDGRPLPRQFW